MNITKKNVEALVEGLEDLIQCAQSAHDNGELWLEAEDADERQGAREDFESALSDLPALLRQVLDVTA